MESPKVELVDNRDSWIGFEQYNVELLSNVTEKYKLLLDVNSETTVYLFRRIKDWREVLNSCLLNPNKREIAYQSILMDRRTQKYFVDFEQVWSAC